MTRPYKLAEQRRWRAAYEQLLKETPEYRDSVVEECARVAELYRPVGYSELSPVAIAAAIRKLKEGV